MRARFALGLLLAVCLLPPVIHANGGDTALSRFQKTVAALQATEPESRARFAAAALTELLVVYLAESDLARSEAAAEESEKKLYSWALAVDRYARQLEAMLVDIERGYPVEIGLSRARDMAVRVNGRQVMLTHPRINQQAAYEQRVLLEFCELSDCTRLNETRMPLRLPLYSDASAPQPTWVFTDDDTVCVFDGIQVFFTTANNLSRLREACQAFFQEVSDLLTEIAWQRLHGAAIEWDALEIRPTPGETEHFVTLNTPGDTVLSPLPLLYANPGLLQQLAPWLRDRSSGLEASLLLDGSRWVGEWQGE